MGVCASIAEITVTRYMLISGRGVHFQQVGFKVWISNDCVWPFQSFSGTGCLSRVAAVPVWLCTLFICYWCCVVIRYSHEPAEEELLSLKVWPGISMSMNLVGQKRENRFWDSRVMALTLLLGWTLEAEAVCFVWNVGNCLLNYSLVMSQKTITFCENKVKSLDFQCGT